MTTKTTKTATKKRTTGKKVAKASPVDKPATTGTRKRHIAEPLSAAQIRAAVGVTAKDMKEVRAIIARYSLATRGRKTTRPAG